MRPAGSSESACLVRDGLGGPASAELHLRRHRRGRRRRRGLRAGRPDLPRRARLVRRRVWPSPSPRSLGEDQRSLFWPKRHVASSLLARFGRPPPPFSRASVASTSRHRHDRPEAATEGRALAGTARQWKRARVSPTWSSSQSVHGLPMARALPTPSTACTRVRCLMKCTCSILSV
jgi:hypothetical protein